MFLYLYCVNNYSGYRKKNVYDNDNRNKNNVSNNNSSCNNSYSSKDDNVFVNDKDEIPK